MLPFVFITYKIFDSDSFIFIEVKDVVCHQWRKAKMISDEKAREILDKIFNHNECANRIKETTEERVYYGISNFLFELLDEVWLSFVYSSFAGCIILSGVIIETALTEELAKEGYSKRRLKKLTLKQLIESAKEAGIIGDETTELADKLRKLRDDYVHPSIKETVARAKSPTSIEDWIQVINRIDKEKFDAKEAIKNADKILLEIYSEQRYPLEKL